MLIKAGDVRTLGVDEPVLAVAEGPKQPGTWAGRRLLWLQGEPAFELSQWCGTCPVLFKRMRGANGTLSAEEAAEVLNTGIDEIDIEVVETFARLLPRGEYLPLLLDVQPRLTQPFGTDDYFSHEQVATWGLDGFWGLPEYPRTPYYRTHRSRVADDAHLYEFVVPMVPPTWNDEGRVTEFRDRLAGGTTATAVALSTLDLCQPADRGPDASDYYQHWALTHFLLDGHHKLQAASQIGSPIRLLCLVSLDASLASRADIERAVEVRRRPEAARPATVA